MKATRLLLRSVLCVLGATAALCAHAQNYFGFGLGSGHATIPAADTTYLGSPFRATPDKTDDVAIDVYIGHQFTPYLGVEAGLAALGNGYSAHYTWLGATSTVNTYLGSLYAAATGTLPLGDSLALIGKVGVAANTMTYSTNCSGAFCSQSRPERHADLMFGLAARFRLTDMWALRVEYEDFGQITSDDFWGTGDSGAIKATAWFVNAQKTF